MVKLSTTLLYLDYLHWKAHSHGAQLMADPSYAPWLAKWRPLLDAQEQETTAATDLHQE